MCSNQSNLKFSSQILNINDVTVYYFIVNSFLRKQYLFAKFDKDIINIRG